MQLLGKEAFAAEDGAAAPGEVQEALWPQRCRPSLPQPSDAKEPPTRHPDHPLRSPWSDRDTPPLLG